MSESRIQPISLLQELDELISRFTTPIDVSMASDEYEAMFFLSIRIQEKMVECQKNGIIVHATEQQKLNYENVLTKQQELNKVTHIRLVNYLISLMYELAKYEPNHEQYKRVFEDIQYLIQLCVNGKCLDFSGEFNRSPLAVACDLQHITLIDLLLDAGANPNILTAEKNPPIFYAIGSANDNASKAVRRMIERGAALYPANPKCSPLFAAVYHDDLDSLEIIADLMQQDQSKTAQQHRERIFSYVLRSAANKAIDEAELDVVWSVLQHCYPEFVTGTARHSNDSSIESPSSAELILWLIRYGIEVEKIKHLIPYLFSNPINDAFSNSMENACLADLKKMFDLLRRNVDLYLVRDDLHEKNKHLDRFCNNLIALVGADDSQSVMEYYATENNLKKIHAAWPKVSCGKNEAGKQLYAYDDRIWGVGALLYTLTNLIDRTLSHLIKKITEDNIIFSADFCHSMRKVTHLCLSFSTLMDDKHMGNMQSTLVAARAKVKSNESEFIKKNELAAKLEKERQRKLIHKKQKEQEKISRQLAAEHVQKLKAEQQLIEESSASPAQSISDTAESVSPSQPKKKKSAKQAERKKERKKAKRQKMREQTDLVVPELCADSLSADEDVSKVTSQDDALASGQTALPTIIVTPADTASPITVLTDMKSSVDELRQQVELLVQTIDQIKMQGAPPVLIEPAYNITRMIGKLPSSFETAFAKVQSAQQCYMVGGAVIALLHYAAGARDSLNAIKDYDIVGECTDSYETLTKYNEFLPTQINNLYQYKYGKTSGLEIDFYHVDGFDLQKDAASRDFRCSAVYLDPTGNIIDSSPNYSGLQDIRAKRVSLIQPDPHYLANKPLCLLRALKFVAKGWTLDSFVQKQVENWNIATIPKEDMLRFRSNLTKLYNGEDGVSRKSFWRALEKYKLAHLIGYIHPSDDLEWQARRLVKVLKLTANGWQEGLHLLSNQPRLDFSQLSPSALAKFSRHLSQLYQGSVSVSQSQLKQMLQQCGLSDLVKYVRPQVLDFAFAPQVGLFQARPVQPPQSMIAVEDPEPGTRSPEPTRRAI